MRIRKHVFAAISADHFKAIVASVRHDDRQFWQACQQQAEVLSLAGLAATAETPRPRDAGRQMHQGRDPEHGSRVFLAENAQTFFQFFSARTFTARAIAAQRDESAYGEPMGQVLFQLATDADRQRS